MARIFKQILLIYGMCLVPGLSLSPPSVTVSQGTNVTLQCLNTMKQPGHVAWFRQVNGSEPLCISSMHSAEKHVCYPSVLKRLEMKSDNRTLTLNLINVDLFDSGLYFCGMLDKYMVFHNATFLKIEGSKPEYEVLPTEISKPGAAFFRGNFDLFPAFLAVCGLAAVLLVVVLILLFRITRSSRNKTNQGNSCQQPQDEQNSDMLNYVALNFTHPTHSAGRRMRQERELNHHVVYAATR